MLFIIPWLVAGSLDLLARVPAPSLSTSPSESSAVERFLNETEKPPVPYHARRRLEASSAKLRESGWIEVLTKYDSSHGFHYEITAEGGSERIRNRALKSVLENEQKNVQRGEWHSANLSSRNYEFNFQGRTSDGMLMMELNPRRLDSRLVEGFALVSPTTGNLVRIEGQLSKSPSFWVKWAKVSRTYEQVGGAIMPVQVESTADVRFAGVSSFSMIYDYAMVNGQAINMPSRNLQGKN